MKALAVSIVVLVLLVPCRAMALDPVMDIPPGEDRILVLGKDVPAPWAGQLYSNETALRWANWLQQYRLRLTQSEQYGRARLQAAETLCARKAEITATGHADAIKLYQERINTQQAQIASLRAEIADPPFYKKVWFGFVAGVVVTGLAVGIGGALIAAVQ